jgi:hypothetical protein
VRTLDTEDIPVISWLILNPLKKTSKHIGLKKIIIIYIYDILRKQMQNPILKILTV